MVSYRRLKIRIVNRVVQELQFLNNIRLKTADNQNRYVNFLQNTIQFLSVNIFIAAGIITFKARYVRIQFFFRHFFMPSNNYIVGISSQIEYVYTKCEMPLLSHATVQNAVFSPYYRYD
jgi:hypothetical protein